LQRAYFVHGDTRFDNLRHISLARLYNLRQRRVYQALRATFTKTRPTPIKVSIRRAPRPEGQSGFIRIDSVYQGDLDRIKGLYYITSADCVTQWELTANCEKISAGFMLPVLEYLLDGYLFRATGISCQQR
jgi:hypothetical protein